MNTLFPITPPFPDVFFYYPDFLSEAEETELYRGILHIELHNLTFQGFKANRKVASFGYDYSFENRKLSKGKNIPSLFDSLLQRVARHSFVKPGEFAELLITEYPVGSVIRHRDAPPFDVIAGISLLSDCIFRLRPHDKEKQSRSSIISFPVKRRSLYIIKILPGASGNTAFRR